MPCLIALTVRRYLAHPFFNGFQRIRCRLRACSGHGFREFADAGGLLSYGYNLPDAYRQTARLVVRILKGDRPGDLPFELPARYELIVNLKTAKAIGLTIPDSFVLLADEVIE